MSDAETIDLPTDCEVEGQAFTFVKATPYTSRDDREIWLFHWRSSCQACGSPFEFHVPSTRVEFSPTRRCRDCRQPGSKADAEERRRRRADRVQRLYALNPDLERQFPNGLPDWLVGPETVR